MTARIVKVESKRATWYEVEVRFLWVFWLDANIVKPGFCSVYLDLDSALESLDKLKKVKTKRSIECHVKF
jgi:hypothetical protein